MPSNSSTFTILVVCSGNICRSPLAEQLLRARLSVAGDAFRVLSAGTIADDGVPMTEQAAALSTRYGGVPEGHRSRLLTQAQVASADLVLTATRAHRAAVVSLFPRASRYAFTLKEFAALADSLGPDVRARLTDPAAVVVAAAAQRGLAQRDDDDIQDPYRRSDEVYERVAVTIDDAVRTAAAALAGSVA